MPPAAELSASQLRRVCDPQSLGFETTASLPVLSDVLGQPRAVAALSFGTSIASHGFNLFAMGLTGSGKTTLIRQYLERRAAAQPVPPDYCYVYNFANPRCPLPLQLPAGTAVTFKSDIDAFVGELKTAMSKAFESDEYSGHREKVVNELEEKRRQELARIELDVRQAGFQLLKGPGGLLLVPATGDKPASDEELESLSAEDKEKLARMRDHLQHEIEESFRAIREFEKSARESLRAFDTESAVFATRHVMEELKSGYRGQPAVLEYLDALQADVIAHADDFRKSKEPEPAPVMPPGPVPPGAERSQSRYEVNVLVDNRGLTGAPVAIETNPTFYNLVGRIEHLTTWGGAATDHTMIKAGALHRANGGYLIIPARECLLNAFAWDGLKRALKDRALRIEELGPQLGILSTVSLDPQSIPLDTKVVLIGSPALYHTLLAYDEDFQKLFKVKAEFTTTMKRDPQSERAYALFVNSITQAEKTLPFDHTAVARVIEYGSRLADDQDELTTRFGDIADLVREAAHLAGQNSHQAVTASDIRIAEQARRYRQNLVEERLQDSFAKGTTLLDTSGQAIGRINGLTVMSMGDCSFGHPVRLTAAVGPGRRGVTSIEREVELSGPIHGKGVLILSGYLMRKYGQQGPLNLSASLVFEQSYGMVEGDSASLAELCVLLSAAAEIPLRQDIAVTGSVNQYGDVQPVGGVTEKVEGFFDLCRARGFTGTHGVLIPASNQRHLMLRDDVVEAVHAGQFHIRLADRVEDALELLTGVAAHEIDVAVAARLDRYSELIKAHQESPAAAAASV